MTDEITHGKPSLILRAFGKHLEDHLCLPSVGVKNRLGAMGKTGCYTYEPPNCVRWRDETHQTTGKLNAKENLRVFSYNETIFPLMPYDGASALPRQNNTP